MATKTAKRRKNGKDDEGSQGEHASVLNDIREDFRCLQSGQEQILAELKALVDASDDDLVARVAQLEKDVAELKRVSTLFPKPPITPP